MGNFNAATIGPFTASGTATAADTFTDRPTIVYSPLTGTDFLKRLMTPIPPSSVLFVLQVGYSAARVMPIMLASINGLANGSNRLQRAPDPRFTRLVELVGDAIVVDVRREKPRQHHPPAQHRKNDQQGEAPEPSQDDDAQQVGNRSSVHSGMLNLSM